MLAVAAACSVSKMSQWQRSERMVALFIICPIAIAYSMGQII